MDEAILSVVIMFLLKEGSRNSYNQDREEPRFARNIRRLLKINLMHGDSFNDIMQRIDEGDLQRLKASLVRVLIRGKVFDHYCYNGKYIVAFDGTGTHSYDYDYSGNCLAKTSKNDKTTYSQAVLEAKLVASNGFCISLATTWLENNTDGLLDKQDCERAAFKRLAETVKQLYPRLPIIMVADALYANSPVIDICQANGWGYMLVIKEGVLKNLYEEITLRPDKKIYKDKKGQATWLNDLELGKHRPSWLLWEELGNKFSWLTNIQIENGQTATQLQEYARLRWKIENEGFNTQKNLGYGLEHKYSRISFTAIKNYYQCMQIAHLIEQLCLLSKEIKALLNSKVTIKKISERIRNILALVDLNIQSLEKLLERKIQIRFD